MPDLRWNASYWAGGYDWSSKGEEWSKIWGSSSAQWFGTILPRIRSFVPATTILEIAPGFGRWTRFLGTMCERYYGVDISAECIDNCKKRFSSASHMQFVANNGTSLAMIPDGSVDLAFSFDSLVHVDAGVIEAYVKQLILKLSEKGAAFIHHSNLAALDSPSGNSHARDPGVSAELFKNAVVAAGGDILRQEIVPWGMVNTINSLDCLSLFARSGAYQTKQTLQVNDKFMEEARYVGAYLAPWEFAV